LASGAAVDTTCMKRHVEALIDLALFALAVFALVRLATGLYDPLTTIAACSGSMWLALRAGVDRLRARRRARRPGVP